MRKECLAILFFSIKIFILDLAYSIIYRWVQRTAYIVRVRTNIGVLANKKGLKYFRVLLRVPICSKDVLFLDNTAITSTAVVNLRKTALN